MKMDLVKAYDRVDLVFPRFILIQVGLPFDVVEWIMTCVCSAHFATLVTNSPMSFFHGNRGMRQGCHLSPSLFLVVIEGFSRLMLEAKRTCKI